jgi:hypothetical protein
MKKLYKITPYVMLGLMTVGVIYLFFYMLKIKH